jgi:hypothetical protein
MARPKRPAPAEDEGDLEHEGLSAANTARGRLQRLVLGHLRKKNEAGEIPTSIRFVFYELEQAGHLSKRLKNQDGTDSKRRPDAYLTEALTHLRNIGLLDWDWIADESRDVDAWYSTDSVRDYLAAAAGQAVLDRFPGVARPVLVCESRGVGGVLARGVARDYRVTVVPVAGQCAGFLRTKAAHYLEDEGTRVLYLGDHDLAGNHIEENTRRVLELATERTFGAGNWERLMLTDAQCRQLQKKGVEPIQKHDRRYKDGRPHEAFEVEALGQSLVTQIVRKRLEQLAPEPLAAVLERERRQREEARRRLRAWK